MKYYQLTYLIFPDLSEEELKSVQENVNSFVQKEGGVLDKINSPLKKGLSCPIKKKKEAFLVSLSFYLKPEKIENLEKKLKAEKTILRYFISAEKFPEKVLIPIPKKLAKPKIKKVELKEIEKKLEEILGQ